MATKPSRSALLSERQQQTLRALREDYHHELCSGVSPRELVLLENPDSLDWGLAMLAYPTLCFLLGDLIYKFGELENMISQMKESRPELLVFYSPYFSLGTARHLNNWKNGRNAMQSETSQCGEFRLSRKSLEYLEAISGIIQIDLVRKIEKAFELVDTYVKPRWHPILLEARRRQTVLENRYKQENMIFTSSVLRRRITSTSDHFEEEQYCGEDHREVSPVAGNDTSSNRQEIYLQGRSLIEQELCRILLAYEQELSDNVTDSKKLASTKIRKIFDAISHTRTVAFLVPSILSISSFLTGISITRPRPHECGNSAFDDGFYASLSQLLVQLLSLYCLVIPLLRSRGIPGLALWFYVSFGICGVSIVGSTVVYSFNWQVAGALSFLSGFFGVLATVQLIEGADAAVKMAMPQGKIKRL